MAITAVNNAVYSYLGINNKTNNKKSTYKSFSASNTNSKDKVTFGMANNETEQQVLVLIKNIFENSFSEIDGKTNAKIIKKSFKKSIIKVANLVKEQLLPLLENWKPPKYQWRLANEETIHRFYNEENGLIKFLQFTPSYEFLKALGINLNKNRVEITLTTLGEEHFLAKAACNLKSKKIDPIQVIKYSDINQKNVLDKAPNKNIFFDF